MSDTKSQSQDAKALTTNQFYKTQGGRAPFIITPSVGSTQVREDGSAYKADPLVSIFVKRRRGSMVQEIDVSNLRRKKGSVAGNFDYFSKYTAETGRHMATQRDKIMFEELSA